MHRKAEEEAAGGANGDDDNVASGLEAEGAAGTEVAGHLQEPALQPLGIGGGVPDLLDRRRIAAAQPYGAGLAGLDEPAAPAGLDQRFRLHH